MNCSFTKAPQETGTATPTGGVVSADLFNKGMVLLMKIMIINGPDFNILDKPEPPDVLNSRLERKAGDLGLSCEFFQSDSEGGLVTLIQNAWGSGADGVILNAGDYAHYSIAIRDAIASINKPVIEVHLTNIHSDEDFRHISMLSAVCKGIISGFGQDGYFLALYALASVL